MRALLVHNRTAGDAVADASELRSMLADAGYQVRVLPSDGAWATGLQDRGVDLVIAVGGDGTAAAVARRVAGTGIPFAVIPFGTANNLAKSLGVVGGLDEIVRHWHDVAPAPFDLGLVTSGSRPRRFVESAGSGLFAEQIRSGDRVVPSPQFVGRETDRAVHLLRHLAERAETADWGVTVDGTDHSGRYVGVEVMNVRFAGPNVPIALGAEMGDGLLDIVLLDAAACARIREYAERRLTTASGTLTDLPVVRGRSVRIEPPPGAPSHLDDAIIRPRGPLTVEIEAAAALVIA